MISQREMQLSDTIMTPDEIRALRKRVGLTQSDFGEVLGVSQIAVSGWERGDRTPGEHRAAAMYQWRKRLDEMGDEREKSWTRELLEAATAAGALAVLLRLFGSR